MQVQAAVLILTLGHYLERSELEPGRAAMEHEILEVVGSVVASAT